MLNLIITIVVVGVILWAINTFVPMDGRVRQILNAVVVIGLVVWILRSAGVFGLVEVLPPRR